MLTHLKNILQTVRQCPLILFIALNLHILWPVFANAKGFVPFHEVHYHKIITSGLHHIYQQDYLGADSIFSAGFPDKSISGLYFKGFLNIVVFDDIGDTLALGRAKGFFQQIERINLKGNYKDTLSSNSPELYLGLSYMQLSYIFSTNSEYLKSVLAARKGLKILKKHDLCLEAQCTRQIYQYYKKRLFSFLRWLPLVDINQQESREFLQEHYYQSNYFSNVLLLSYLWMLFDIGENQTGLNYIEEVLRVYPQSRIFNLIKADFLYKLHRYKESSKIFEAVKMEYQHLYNDDNNSCVPINYLSAVGNLLRLYSDMGDTLKRNHNGQIWFSPETQKQNKWLPPSLSKDLERFRYLY